MRISKIFSDKKCWFCAAGMHGFTLVEVLVALVITAVSLIAAYRAAGLATAEHQWLRTRTLAAWVAQNRLAELTLMPPAAQTVSNRGQAQQAGEAYVWREQFQNSFSPRFRRVEVAVARADDPGYVLASVVGYVEVAK